MVGRTCYSFQASKLIIVAVSFFRNASEALKLPHFRKRLDVSFLMVVPWICVSISKSQVICQKAKKTPFFAFFGDTPQKNFKKC